MLKTHHTHAPPQSPNSSINNTAHTVYATPTRWTRTALLANQTFCTAGILLLPVKSFTTMTCCTPTQQCKPHLKWHTHYPCVYYGVTRQDMTVDFTLYTRHTTTNTYYVPHNFFAPTPTTSEQLICKLFTLEAIFGFLAFFSEIKSTFI